MPVVNPISLTPVVVTPSGGVSGAVSGAIITTTTRPISTIPQQIIGFIPLTDCDYEECRTYEGSCYTNKVFGTVNVNGSTYENDMSTFFLNDQMHRTTIFVLQKLDTRLKIWGDEATIGSTNTTVYPYVSTYGTFFNYGYFTTAHANYIGIQINWGHVLTVSGPGTYRLKVYSPSFIAGGTAIDPNPALNKPNPYPYCMTSENFKLMPFSCDAANFTAKFEAYQSGKVGSHLSNGLVFDLCNINLYDSIRLPGIFGHKKGEDDKIDLEYQNGLIDPVRDETILKYQWMCTPVPQYIHDRFMVYGLMATSLYVSDYCMNNSDYTIKLKRIRKAGGYEPVYDRNTRLAPVTVDFKEGIQSIIKSDSCDKIR